MNHDRDGFDKYVGHEFDFFGVDCNQFKLNDVVWEALEDESDGYRSYLDSVVRKNSDGIFYRAPLARVKLVYEDDGDLNFYKLVDVSDGHVWLVFGTDYSDDWYPSFRFNYTAKAPAESIVAVEEVKPLVFDPRTVGLPPIRRARKRRQKGQTHKFNRS